MFVRAISSIFIDSDINNAKIEIIDGAGHLVNIDAHIETNNLAIDFIRNQSKIYNETIEEVGATVVQD